MSILHFVIVCPLPFLAGFVDSIAGGGGLISLPAYLFAGLPIHAAIGTNKFSSAFGTSLSTFRFIKGKLVIVKLAIPSVFCGFLGWMFFRFGMTDEVEGPGLSSSCLNIYSLKNLVKTFYSRNLHLLEHKSTRLKATSPEAFLYFLYNFFLLACYPTFQSSVSFFLLQAEEESHMIQNEFISCHPSQRKYTFDNLYFKCSSKFHLHFLQLIK